MKIFHIGDLHIGKQLHQYNLKQDQEFILNQIVEYAKKEKPDAVLITGDIYDRAAPSAEAVGVFDVFLTGLSELPHQPEILIIAGNHDSAARLDFASSILEKHRVHIVGTAPEAAGEFMKKVTLEDAYGKVNFYLCPFLKPGYVKNLLQEEGNFEAEKVNLQKEKHRGEKANKIENAFEKLEEENTGKETAEERNLAQEKTKEEKIFLTYDEAVHKMIEREHINTAERNVILSHQFYLWGNQEIERAQSEIITVGNIDSVHADCLEMFDYAALGHIHKPSAVGRENIRYCGSPLAYSVSEAGQKKGILMAELLEKGTEVSVHVLPLKPLRQVRKLEGRLEEILKEEKSSDFVSILLKDEETLLDVRQKLMEKFDHILEIRLYNSHIREFYEEEPMVLEELNPLEIFKQFYQEIRTKEMDSGQEKLLSDIIRECDGM